jgi:hypothetical protein
MKTALKKSALVAITFVFVTFASSSPAAAPAPLPQNYTGVLTHGEFTSCGGELLNPPAYSVTGTWVLRIDPVTKHQDQLPPSAQLTLLVLRDSSRYLLFPNVDLTPISAQDGVYTYSFGSQVIVTLDTNTHPATFSWGVQFFDNCSIRNYRSLAYVGVAN